MAIDDRIRLVLPRILSLTVIGAVAGAAYGYATAGGAIPTGIARGTLTGAGNAAGPRALPAQCRAAVAGLSRRLPGGHRGRPVAAAPSRQQGHDQHLARRYPVLLCRDVRHHLPARSEQPARPERPAELHHRPLSQAARRAARI